jgi:hypothetical protein
MHPNGQIPAYEWNFSDVNPPVQGISAWRIYCKEKAATGKGDRKFLQRIFQKLMLNFTLWVNRKDAFGNNVSTAARGSDDVMPTPGLCRVDEAPSLPAFLSML